jgi:hypothetical protein
VESIGEGVGDAEVGAIYRLDPDPAEGEPTLEDWLPDAGTHPSFLAVDAEGEMLYWTDNRDNVLRRRPLAGGATEVLADLAAKLLDVLDDLDRTSEVAETSADEGLAGGVRAVHRKLVDALIAAGVERVDEPGVPFDATRHEAVQQVPADEPVDEPQVADVLRPGYLHGDRVLRAAMVSVRQ